MSKATQNNEVLAFADHWRTVTGTDPALLIFDSKVTTQAQLRCSPCRPAPGPH